MNNEEVYPSVNMEEIAALLDEVMKVMVNFEMRIAEERYLNERLEELKEMENLQVALTNQRYLNKLLKDLDAVLAEQQYLSELLENMDTMEYLAREIVELRNNNSGHRILQYFKPELAPKK